MREFPFSREDENGVVLAECGLPNKLLRYIPEGSHCLAFIDPHSDTIFNQLQIPVLKEEIVEAAKAAADPKLARRAREVIEFLEASGQDRFYIRFVGD